MTGDALWHAKYIHVLLNSANVINAYSFDVNLFVGVTRT